MAALGAAAIDDLAASTSSRCVSACHSATRRIGGDIRSRSHAKRGGPCLVTRHEFSLWTGEPVPNANNATGVLPGVRTLATPRLTPDRVFQRLSEVRPAAPGGAYAAFFSSQLGGIVTEPGFMVVPVDDRMLTRGHGVFDSVILTSGHLYMLEAHVTRLRLSAEMVGFTLPYSQEGVMRILLDTAAASRKLNGRLLVWATRGRGGFDVSDGGVYEPCLYAVVLEDVMNEKVDRIQGWRVTTSPVQPKPPYFASLCSNNYLPNSLALMEAESRGFDAAVFVDEEEFVLEGTSFNVGIITEEDVLVYPPFDQTIAGITLQRCAQLAREFYHPKDCPVAAVEQRPIPLEEALAAKEVIAFGSSFGVVGIGEWDGTRIGDGGPGLVAMAVYRLLTNDMHPRDGSAGLLSEVPYGYLSGMRDQLQ